MSASAVPRPRSALSGLLLLPPSRRSPIPVARPRSPARSYPGGAVTLADGTFAATAGPQVLIIDGDTGEVVKRKTVEVPTGATTDIVFNGLQAMPDGNIVVKNIGRPAGCPAQGYAAVTGALQRPPAPPPPLAIRLRMQLRRGRKPSCRPAADLPALRPNRSPSPPLWPAPCARRLRSARL